MQVVHTYIDKFRTFTPICLSDHRPQQQMARAISILSKECLCLPVKSTDSPVVRVYSAQPWCLARDCSLTAQEGAMLAATVTPSISQDHHQPGCRQENPTQQ